MEIDTQIRHCPRRVKSYVLYCRADDHATIVISDQLDETQRLRAYKHELDHIAHDDFAEADVDACEVRAHRRGG